jgi:hypothetical protein
MTRWTRTGMIVLAALAVAAVIRADKERCKVKIGDEYRLIESKYTKGGCEVEAKRDAAPRLCEPGDKKFGIKYMYDGTIYEAEGYCSVSLARPSTSSSSGKERCKVKDGDDWHYLPRTFSKGGCSLEAKRHVGPKLCEGGGRRFHYTYLFDDTTYEDEGLCSLVR